MKKRSAKKSGMKKYIFKKSDDKSYGCMMCKGSGGGIYGLGFIGAVIYYIQAAPSFWVGVLGILKAIVWPAFLVYELLKFLAA